MRGPSGRIDRRGFARVAGYALAAGLVGGCGGGDTEGNAEFRQDFERPAVDTPRPVEKPEKSKYSKELSPRERRAKQQAG